jgi:hypothetical protein
MAAMMEFLWGDVMETWRAALKVSSMVAEKAGWWEMTTVHQMASWSATADSTLESTPLHSNALKTRTALSENMFV